MSKTVAFKIPAPKSQAADAWVGEGVEPHLKAAKIDGVAATATSAAMKRFTIDVPADLHARAKIGCARRGVFMADEIRRWLEAEFPEET
jgi:hypothetical protein